MSKPPRSVERRREAAVRLQRLVKRVIVCHRRESTNVLPMGNTSTGVTRSFGGSGTNQNGCIEITVPYQLLARRKPYLTCTQDRKVRAHCAVALPPARLESRRDDLGNWSGRRKLDPLIGTARKGHSPIGLLTGRLIDKTLDWIRSSAANEQCNRKNAPSCSFHTQVET